MNSSNNACFLILSLLSVLLLCTITPSFSQVYFDIPVQLDFYRAKSDQLNYERRGVVINPSVGIVLVGNHTSKFEGHLGAGLFISKFDHEVVNETFEYEAVGLIQSSFTGYFNFNNRVQAGSELPLAGSISAERDSILISMMNTVIERAKATIISIREVALIFGMMLTRY